METVWLAIGGAFSGNSDGRRRSREKHQLLKVESSARDRWIWNGCVWDRSETDVRWIWDVCELDLRWIWDRFENCDIDLRWMWELWYRFEMDLKWIWDGSKMDLRCIRDGSELNLIQSALIQFTICVWKRCKACTTTIQLGPSVCLSATSFEKIFWQIRAISNFLR